MLEYLEGFTGEDTRTVQDLINRDFADATPDEIKLYARWTTAHEMQDAKFQAELAAIEKECEARIEQSGKLADYAAAALEDRAKRARERFASLGD